jgi:hypothetical protein
MAFVPEGRCSRWTLSQALQEPSPQLPLRQQIRRLGQWAERSIIQMFIAEDFIEMKEATSNAERSERVKGLSRMERILGWRSSTY